MKISNIIPSNLSIFSTTFFAFVTTFATTFITTSASADTIALVTTASPASTSITTVDVTTSEWRITSDKKMAKAGKITFRVKNLGHDEHELEIIRIDNKKHNMLPLGKHASVDEDWLKTVAIDEIEHLEPGNSKSFSVHLTAGNYALICNKVETEADGTIEAHYHMGMSIAFTVE
ncbi:MAG: hypothetical protein ACC707_04210 [Thiohalomonadales bacterium]